MSCPHTEVIETVVTTTTEQSAWGEVIQRGRSYNVTYRCVECGELVPRCYINAAWPCPETNCDICPRIYDT